MTLIDITLLTCKKHLQPEPVNQYIQNILDERMYLQKALEAKGLSVTTRSWDDPHYDWSQTRAIVFRTIWDYFERYDEFSTWLEQLKTKTQLINPYNLIQWNIDKHYLADLQSQGIAIVPTVFVDTRSYKSLQSVCKNQGWTDIVIKPAISGGALETYKVIEKDRADYEDRFKKLVSERDMLVQPFIKSITTRGEASLMLFNGRFTHAILKKAKTGDYRVQDDYGGTVHPYIPTIEEINFAEHVFACCDPIPAYGRADIVWDEQGNILLGELEIIEPELWVRNYPASAEPFAEGVCKYLKISRGVRE